MQISINFFKQPISHCQDPISSACPGKVMPGLYIPEGIKSVSTLARGGGFRKIPA